ncbi:MAG: hypothetical protein WAM82_25045 [Thermoanaerobaculia bacterium]
MFYEIYTAFVAAFLEAADRLRRGDFPKTLESVVGGKTREPRLQGSRDSALSSQGKQKN